MSMSLVDSAVATIVIVWGTAHAVTTRAHTRQVNPNPNPDPNPSPNPNPNPNPTLTLTPTPTP